MKIDVGDRQGIDGERTLHIQGTNRVMRLGMGVGGWVSYVTYIHTRSIHTFPRTLVQVRHFVFQPDLQIKRTHLSQTDKQKGSHGGHVCIYMRVIWC